MSRIRLFWRWYKKVRAEHNDYSLVYAVYDAWHNSKHFVDVENDFGDNKRNERTNQGEYND